jgi:nicotinate-nucleotide pyrophosphorylase (carboxylating)
MIAAVLAEDVGAGDLTTDAIVPAAQTAVGRIVLREPGVICGLDEAAAVFHELDPGLCVEPAVADGAAVDAVPFAAARLTGSARAILTGERTALNLLQRMSGIATATRRYVLAVEGTGCQILDTRKTAPGLRALDKRAVRLGGGTNHRSALDDAVLIKDNHIAIAGGIAAAVTAVRSVRPGTAVEVEVDTLEQLDEALTTGAEAVLLDNMDVTTMAEAVRRTAGRARLEASGGITLESVRAIAETGVDAISVGALTHSVRGLDIALEVEP